MMLKGLQEKSRKLKKINLGLWKCRTIIGRVRAEMTVRENDLNSQIKAQAQRTKILAEETAILKEHLAEEKRERLLQREIIDRMMEREDKTEEEKKKAGGLSGKESVSPESVWKGVPSVDTSNPPPMKLSDQKTAQEAARKVPPMGGTGTLGLSVGNGGKFQGGEEEKTSYPPKAQKTQLTLVSVKDRNEEKERRHAEGKNKQNEKRKRTKMRTG